MIFLEALGAAISFASLMWSPHPSFFEVTPQSPQWYELCSNHYKSFDPDTGMWVDYNGKYHYCRFKR